MQPTSTSSSRDDFILIALNIFLLNSHKIWKYENMKIYEKHIEGIKGEAQSRGRKINDEREIYWILSFLSLFLITVVVVVVVIFVPRAFLSSKHIRLPSQQSIIHSCWWWCCCCCCWGAHDDIKWNGWMKQYKKIVLSYAIIISSCLMD